MSGTAKAAALGIAALVAVATARTTGVLGSGNADRLVALTEGFQAGLVAGATLPDYQLPDRGRSIRDDLDIAEYTAAGNPPMIPHTLVLAPGPQIHRIYNGYWYWRRQSVADLHRRAWERGERSRFYPYASSFEDAIAEMGVSGGSSR